MKPTSNPNNAGHAVTLRGALARLFGRAAGGGAPDPAARAQDIQDRQQLSEQLEDLRDIYARMGPLGQDFDRLLTQAGITEKPVPQRSTGYIATYNYVIGDDIVNEIHYDPATLGQRNSILHRRFHEGIHALQFTRAACLYAIPAGGFSPFALDARSYVYTHILTELDAYVKQAWLTREAMRAAPEIGAKLESGTFDRHMDKTLSKGYPLGITLAQGALFFRHMVKGLDLGGTPYPMIEGYIDAALSIYEREVVKLGFPRHVCAIGRQDIADIGASYGPNLYAHAAPEFFNSIFRLTAATERRIEAINRRLGIREEELPQFEHALAAHGIDKSEFLSLCRANRCEEIAARVDARAAPRRPGKSDHMNRQKRCL